MNVKRFTAPTSRDALALVRQAFGDDAIVMSTRPCAEGIEVVAMAGDSVQQLERIGAQADHVRAPQRQPLPEWATDDNSPPSNGARHALPAAMKRLLQNSFSTPAALEQPPRAARVSPSVPTPQRVAAAPASSWRQVAPAQRQRTEPAMSAPASVQDDVEQLQMSTLSFQDYVRQRMLKRRDAELAAADQSAPQAQQRVAPVVAPIAAARQRALAQQQRPAPDRQQLAAAARELPVLRDELPLEQLKAAPTMAEAPAFEAPRAAPPARAAAVPAAAAGRGREQIEMMSELRSMRGLIEQRFGALAFMEKLQRQPRQAQLAQRLLDAGFSPALIRRLVDGLPDDVEESSWAATVLERNLATAERDPTLEEQGGIFALVGATGVGKTTSTAKLAAAFAARFGAANLGLITLDAYRVGAHEQLRTYGRILGVPVHTAHDRASLEDLLDLLSAKRMILIDTAGMAQRDSRTRELLEMVSHRSIQRLLVINASAQGETIEDQLGAYAAQHCSGIVLSKLDEAVKLAPALDSLMRHKLKVVAVANGQRVPEDWHRLSASALVQRALKAAPGPAWRLNDNDVNLIFAAGQGLAPVVAGAPQTVALA